MKNLVQKLFHKSDWTTSVMARPAVPKTLSKRTATGSASISGTVVQSDGTTPYTYGTYISVLDTFGFELKRTYAGYEGTFEITGLPAGTYTLMINRYQDGVSFLGNTDDPFSAQWITVVDGQASSGNTMVVPSPTSNGEEIEITISGTFFYESSPLPNTSGTIRTIHAESGASNHMNYSSDSEGAFSTSAIVIPGDYYIMIHPDDGYEAQWWDGKSVVADEPTLVSLTTDVSGKEIHLQMGASVSGTILQQNGETINRSFDIDLVGENGLVYSNRYVFTGNSAFELEGIPSGSYCLKYSSYSDQFYSRYYPASETPSTATRLDIASGQKIENIEIRVPDSPTSTENETGTISGNVTYGNAALDFDASITFVYQNSSVYRNSYGPIDNSSFIEQVTASEPFKILIEPDNHYYALPTWYPNTIEEASAEYISVDPDGSKEISVQLQSGGSAGGFLREEAGNAFDFRALTEMNLEYVFFIAGQREHSKTSFAHLTPMNGLRFIGLEPGTHSAWACLLSEGSNSFEAMAGKQGYSPGTQLGPFTVEEKKTTVVETSMNLKSGTINVTLPGSQNVYAACYDNHDRLVSLILLEEYNLSAASRFFSRDWNYPVSGPGGSSTPVTIPFLATGDYKLAVGSPGKSGQIDIQWYGMDQKITVGSVVEEEKLFLYPDIPDQAKNITVTDGQITDVSFATTSVILKAENKKSNLSLSAQTGTVSYNLGRPAGKNCSISVLSFDGRCLRKWNLSSGSGTLSIGGKNRMPSGTYLIVLTNGDQQKTIRLPVIR
ncbi:MAG: carboxypeptidase-like regulatory domain-containing protein [Fibrobacterota bacterium]